MGRDLLDTEQSNVLSVCQVQDFEAEVRVLETCTQSGRRAEPLHRLSAAEEPEAWCA